MTDRLRHGLSFVRTRAIAEGDDESKCLPLSPLLAMLQNASSQEATAPHIGWDTTMHAATPALVVAALLTAFVYPALIWQLWVLRHSFEIAARAPVLVGICGMAALSVVLAVFVHWILLLESNGLPCYVMLLTSNFCVAMFACPYPLRAIQLVVAYNTHYRLKYARYVKTNTILKISAVAGTIVFVAALYALYGKPERYGRGVYGCYFFDDRLLVFAALCVSSGPTLFAMFELMKVHDAFGIRTEIVRLIVPIMVSGGVLFAIQELLHANVIEGSRSVHFLQEISIFISAFNLLFWSILVPVSTYYGWCGIANGFVVPLEGQTLQSVDSKEGVYDYAQEGGEVAEIFGEFCRKSLCMESWDFIMDCMTYKKLEKLQEQFTSFMVIVDRYLRSTSPQEVNLGSKMQRRLLQFQTLSAFTNLEEETRSTVLDDAVAEIILMLEQNILTKFKLTPAKQEYEQRKLVEADLQSARREAGGDKGLLGLMTSVALGKMGSPMSHGSAEGHRGSVTVRHTPSP